MSQSQEASLDDLIGCYLERIDQGEVVDADEFVASHPSLREPFLNFVDQHRQVAQLAAPESDQRIGPYRLLNRIGQGGMSVVYAAQLETDKKRSNSQPVALKVLSTIAASDTDLRRRFQREAETIRVLDHPNIVPLRDFGTDQGLPYLAMELVNGATLAQLIEDRKSNCDPANNSADDWIDQVVQWIATAADAVHYAHEQGVIHRDIKPSNLIVDGDDKLWLADFGLASTEAAHSIVTRTGQLVGTPHYMSPEQASEDSRSVDRRTDVYSLGATLYELVALQRPYEGDRFRVLSKIVAGSLTPPSRITHVPRDLEAIILKAMAHSPEERYGAAADLAEDLRRFAAGRVTVASLPGPAERLVNWVARHPRQSLAALAAVAAVVVTAFTVQFIGGRRLTAVNLQLEK